MASPVVTALAEGFTGGTGDAISPSFSAPTAGDIILAIVGTDSLSGSPTVSTSGYVRQGANDNINFYTKLSDGTETSLAGNIGGGGFYFICKISGCPSTGFTNSVDSASIYDVGTTISSAAAYVDVNLDLVVLTVCMGKRSSVTNYTGVSIGSSFVEKADLPYLSGASNRHATGYATKDVANPSGDGSESYTWTFSHTTTDNTTRNIAFQAAPAPISGTGTIAAGDPTVTSTGRKEAAGTGGSISAAVTGPTSTGQKEGQGTGSISAPVATMPSTGVAGRTGTGAISAPATVPDSPGIPDKFGTSIIPELAVLTSDGFADTPEAGTGEVVAGDPVTSASGSKSVGGTGTISSPESLTAVGSKSVPGTGTITPTAVLTASGSKSVSGTGEIPVSTVTFSSDELKNGFGQGVLAGGDPVLTGSGGVVVDKSGTGLIAVEAILSAIGSGAHRGTVIVPVGSALTSLGHDGPLEPGIRRWNGVSEDIVQLYILESRGPDVFREASIEAF